MLAVRVVILAALVVWLGGMAMLAFQVEPAVGRLLLGSDLTHGRDLAEQLMTDLRHRFQLVAYACGATVIVGLFVLKFVGPPPSGFVPRLALAAVMLAATIYAGTARIAHGPALGLTSLTLAAGLLSLFWYARE